MTKLPKKTQYLLKKQVNLNQPIKLSMQNMHIIRFNKFFISNIIFYLIDLYDNNAHMIFLYEIFYIQKNMSDSWDWDNKNKLLITKREIVFKKKFKLNKKIDYW